MGREDQASLLQAKDTCLESDAASTSTRADDTEQRSIASTSSYSTGRVCEHEVDKSILSASSEYTIDRVASRRSRSLCEVDAESPSATWDSNLSPSCYLESGVCERSASPGITLRRTSESEDVCLISSETCGQHLSSATGTTSLYRNSPSDITCSFVAATAEELFGSDSKILLVNCAYRNSPGNHSEVDSDDDVASQDSGTLGPSKYRETAYDLGYSPDVTMKTMSVRRYLRWSRLRTCSLESDRDQHILVATIVGATGPRPTRFSL
eukprot:TRINITY_DN39396_c0_g1_i1.p1 TRINITY_DN39396_c0_g1~~TRINITY_DN39396_c0_g1_i1.p1  ORF type:complete len:267 (-),score=14.26 TRINITY_DN39396_c0_g1_i1:227-1027(-)